MYTYMRRNAVMEHFEQQFGVSLCEVRNSLKTLLINLTGPEIEQFLKEQAKLAGVDMSEGVCANNADALFIAKRVESTEMNEMRERYLFNKIDYIFFNDVLRIYKYKALSLCRIFRMMAGEIPVDEQLFEDLDIEVFNDLIREADVTRIAFPLMRNYELAKRAKQKGETLSTYLEKHIDENKMNGGAVCYSNLLPKDVLVDECRLASDPTQYVPMTEAMEERFMQKQTDEFYQKPKRDAGC